MTEPIIKVVSDPTRDEVSFKANVDTRIDQKLKGVSVWVITVVLSVAFGGIIASLWDLNGKIYTVVGQEAVRSEISDLRKQKIEVLEAEKILLNKNIETLESEKKELFEKLQAYKGASK